ncbi:hypothetical protein [Geodermatophilus sp. URMC 60]|jgi:poly-gamma-glutamate capsule biosynthesis protein CapA/YwtB (metallophosphatase superfamily)
MTLATALSGLVTTCQRLRAELETLGLTVREDAPAERAVIDRLGGAVDDLVGRAEEACRVAVHAAEAGERLDLVDAQRHLVAMQAALTTLADRFCGDVNSYEALDPVVVLRHHGHDWAAWVEVVREGIGRCRPRISAVQEEQSLCWQELADRASIGPVYVHTPGRTA